MESNIIEDKLDGAILDAIEQLGKLPAGSPERLKATVAVSTLYRTRDQKYKAEAEYNAVIDAKEMELKQRREELEFEKSENRKARTLQTVTTAATLCFWGYQFAKTLKFEETGTATSSVFKTLYKVFKL